MNDAYIILHFELLIIDLPVSRSSSYYFMLFICCYFFAEYYDKILKIRIGYIASETVFLQIEIVCATAQCLYNLILFKRTIDTRIACPVYS